MTASNALFGFCLLNFDFSFLPLARKAILSYWRLKYPRADWHGSCSYLERIKNAPR